MNNMLKQCSLITILLSVFTSTQLYSKAVIFSGITNRILPMLKEIGNALDENRWSIGELISTPSTITNPGVYILTNDIETNSGIIIDSDNVTLDLNGYMVYDNTGTNTPIIIENEHRNIYIKNGSINGKADTSTTSGLLIKPGATLIQVEDLKILECYTGIKLNGSSSEKVSECKISNCMIVTCSKGMVANYGVKNIFLNCTAYNCSQAGFELNDSELNFFEQCSAIHITNGNPTKNAIGFASTDGCGNIFKECVVNGTFKSSSNFGYTATGFLLKDSETRSKIYDSIVNRSLCSGCGTSYGIHLDFKINDDALDTALYTGNLADDDILIVDWSPETRFIALGGKDNDVRILTFDGTTLKQVDEKNFNADINALAWSPDGTYLAVGTDTSGSNEFFVYEFDSSPLDPSSIITLKDSKPIADHVHSVAWAPNSRFIALGIDVSVSEYEIQVWGFNGSSLTTSEVYTVQRTSDVKSISFSPDGKYLAAVYDDTLEIFSFDPTLDMTLVSVDAQISYGGTLESVDWSPLVCGSKYYLAVGGSRANNKTIETFAFTNEVLVSLETADHGANINEIKWSPNGKYLLAGGNVSGSNHLRLYSFNPSATDGSRLTIAHSGTHVCNPVYSLDWEASGRYLIAVGCTLSNDTSIFEVATTPHRCVIENNEITDAQIGIEGSSGSNLIIRNIGFYNKICFSNGVFNTFIEGLNENPTNIDNICLPPFYYGILKPSSGNGNGSGCHGHGEEEECEEEDD